MRKFLVIGLMLNIIISSPIYCEVRLSHIFSDHMILQRDVPIKIWGKADPNERITISIIDQKIKIKAGVDSKWQTTIQPMKAGGPYTLSVVGDNEITLNDILVGDVWICSGQSNMNWKLSFAKNAQEEIKNSNIPQIRLFKMPQVLSSTVQQDIPEGEWQLCNPNSATNFSAVAYFFGKNLYASKNIPIGIIDISWGGTNIQAWSTPEIMQSIPALNTAYNNYLGKDLNKMMSDNENITAAWLEKIQNEDKGEKQSWYQTSCNRSDWQQIELPAFWDRASTGISNGIVWFSKTFTLSTEEITNKLTINLGTIDDMDVTYLNGNKIGESNDYLAIRSYIVSPEILKTGENTIVVKVIDNGGDGGFSGNPADMYIKTNSNKIDISGIWTYKCGVTEESPRILTFGPSAFPASIFISLINPLTSFAIKGFCWYQGEANAANSTMYNGLLESMIQDWRRYWNMGDLPFLIVQLSSYDTPKQYKWNVIREAQLKASQDLTNTGLVVTIDNTETTELHPRNKQDVGYRLSLAARAIAYKDSIEWSGPIYKSFAIEGSLISVAFDHAGNKLVAKSPSGLLNEFEIAGSDKVFHHATAVIEGNTVKVSNFEVPKPMAARYAWSNNPTGANLFNDDKLPASPFRTDNW